MFMKEKYINDITFRLSLVETYIRQENSMNLYDANIHAETFICDLLNIIFGYHLENLNFFSMFLPSKHLISKLKEGKRRRWTL